jgi:hypothetical protein
MNAYIKPINLTFHVLLSRITQATMNDAERRLRLKSRNALKASALFRSAPTTDTGSSVVTGDRSGVNGDHSRPPPGRLQAQRRETRAHLQMQLATALALKSKSEYFGWLRAYVTRLAGTYLNTSRLFLGGMYQCTLLRDCDH